MLRGRSNNRRGQNSCQGMKRLPRQPSLVQAVNPQVTALKQPPSAICGIGHVFLLGMTVLISEVIDLTAAKSLAYLLAPCLPKETQEELVEDVVIANQVANTINEIEEAQFIPIAFE